MAGPSSNTRGGGLSANARRLIIILAGLAVLPAVTVPVDYALRARRQEQSAVRWMRVLDLSSPALWPSGTALRHPETVVPGVDLRHAPFLPINRSPHKNNPQGAGAP